MRVILDGKELNVKGGTVSDLLRAAGINPETVLVRKGNALVPSDEPVRSGDILETIAVISGG